MGSGVQNKPQGALPFAPCLVRLLAVCAIIALSVSQAQAADPLVLHMPEKQPTQCDPISLSWSGGTPNYTIVITSQLTPVFTTPATVFANLTNTSITWTANTCGGLNVTVDASDSGGLKSQIWFTLTASANMSCLTYNEQNSPQCMTVSSSLHLPSATAAPSFATPGHRSALFPLVLGALIAAGAAAVCSL